MHTHTQTHFHTETFTRKHFNTQTLLYTDSFTHIRFYMQMPFYRRTHTFTHKRFYTQTLLHTDTDAFPHRPFYTQTLLHKHFYTHTLLHTDAFTRKHFYIQTLLHTDAFTLRHFYTQSLFHTDPFTHRPFYTQTLLHRRFHRDFYTETLTKRGTTGWPQLQTKVRKHSCNGNAKKSQKCTRPGSVPWSTHNPMQGIRSLRYKISSAPWCRGWPQLQTQVGKHSRNGNATKCKSTQTKAPYHGIQKNLELRARMLWMIPQ